MAARASLKTPASSYAQRGEGGHFTSTKRIGGTKKALPGDRQGSIQRQQSN